MEALTLDDSVNLITKQENDNNTIYREGQHEAPKPKWTATINQAQAVGNDSIEAQGERLAQQLESDELQAEE